MAKKDICSHCYTPIKIRNQSGYCDHLRYPESCEVCSGQLADKKQSVNRENWKELYRKMTKGTPRDKAVEAFIEELLRSVDLEYESNKD